MYMCAYCFSKLFKFHIFTKPMCLAKMSMLSKQKYS